jgi:hypothetical protein
MAIIGEVSPDAMQDLRQHLRRMRRPPGPALARIMEAPLGESLDVHRPGRPMGEARDIEPSVAAEKSSGSIRRCFLEWPIPRLSFAICPGAFPPGGCVMLILVPWKPVVVVWLVLSGIVLAGYVASTLMEGRNPFVPYSLHRSNHAEHRRYPRRPA